MLEGKSNLDVVRVEMGQPQGGWFLLCLKLHCDVSSNLPNSPRELCWEALVVQTRISPSSWADKAPQDTAQADMVLSPSPLHPWLLIRGPKSQVNMAGQTPWLQHVYHLQTPVCMIFCALEGSLVTAS